MGKSESEIKVYKRMYYLLNQKKLCEYSRNYYSYKKCQGDLQVEDINVQMKNFLKNYKKNNTNKNIIKEDNKIINNVKIDKTNTIIKFD